MLQSHLTIFYSLSLDAFDLKNVITFFHGSLNSAYSKIYGIQKISIFSPIHKNTWI